MRKQWLGICIAADAHGVLRDDGQQQGAVTHSLRCVMVRLLKSAGHPAHF